MRTYSTAGADLQSVDHLRRRFKELGRRIEAGDETSLLIWLIPGTFACAHRPLRHNRLYGGSVRNLDATATPLVVDWSKKVLEQGIRSIICLMSQEEVALYARLELGARDLPAFYRQSGFEVAWIPWRDPAHVRADPKALRKKQDKVSEEALRHFDVLPKAVLLHCSAGIDRSAPVATFIQARRGINAA
jgi:hypothetical protein